MRLLIVDDEPIIRNGLKKMAQGYSGVFQKIDTMANGLEAYEAVEQSEYDLVLTDIRMPKVDGLGLCRLLQENYPHILKVVISGYGDFDYARKCLSYGVKHYLLKPVTPSDLYTMLDQLLQSQSRDYVSVSQYLEWVERMEQSLWSLQNDEMSRLLEEWQRYCSSLPFKPLKGLNHDVLELIAKFLCGRSAIVPSWLMESFGAANKKELHEEFSQRLYMLREELLAARQGKYKDPMEEAKSYIDTHLSVEVSLKEVADMVGLHPTYFSGLFRKMTGQTFISYRIQKRMEKACELLAVPHLRTVDIAVSVGYEDYPHFTKTFKKLIGMSPSEYRNQLGIK